MARTAQWRGQITEVAEIYHRISAANDSGHLMERTREALARWGNWQRTAHGIQLGYPKCAAFTPSLPRGEGEGEYRDSEAERVEGIMLILKGMNARAYEALEQWYCWGASPIDAAARIRVSLASYKIYRQAGEYFVAGCLSAPIS